MSVNKTRCCVCNKKVKLMPIECKCGVITCLSHRFPSHNCNFDYYKEHQNLIEKKNPKVISDKIEKI